MCVKTKIYSCWQLVMEVTKVDWQDEFTVCPNCDYAGGFHTIIQPQGQDKNMLMICPRCKNCYDVGCKIL
eukprot:g5535.t1